MFVQMLKDIITTGIWIYYGWFVFNIEFTIETNVFWPEEDDIMSSKRCHFKRK